MRTRRQISGAAALYEAAIGGVEVVPNVSRTGQIDMQIFAFNFKVFGRNTGVFFNVQFSFKSERTREGADERISGVGG